MCNMKHLRLLSFAFLSIVLFACKEETTDAPFTIEGITTIVGWDF